MKTIDLLSSLMEKAGIDLKAPENKDIFSSQTEIPDSVAEALEENLLTVASAVSNSKVKNTIIAKFANGIDSEIANRAATLGLTEDKISSISGEKGTGKKLQLLLDSINEKIEEAKESGSKIKPELKVLEKQLSDLNAELSKYKTDYIPKSDYEKFVAEKENELLNNSVIQEFMQKSWSDIYSEDLRPILAKTKLDAKLKELGAKLIRKDGVIEIVDSETGTEKFDKSNKLVKFAPLVDSLMTDNKFIKVSDPNQEKKETKGENPTYPGQKMRSNLSLIDELTANI